MLKDMEDKLVTEFVGHQLEMMLQLMYSVSLVPRPFWEGETAWERG